MNIRYIKLSNGQELVGNQVDTNAKEIIMEKDVAVVFMAQAPDESGNPVVNIAPFAPFSGTKEIPLNKKHIVTNVPANKELSDFYKQATGKATILTPKESSIIIP